MRIKLVILMMKYSLRINLENFLQIENYKRTVSENTIFKKFTWEKTCSNMLLVYKNI